MKKIIHYCWFGGKPLPKLAKKCLNSWKKYLPDFEIMEWNENNFDVNMTEFSKEAYKNKKWAFVSDVARVYALKNYGGLYLDTDMMVTSKIDSLFEDNFFAGWESEYNVAVGVMWAKEKENKIINTLWNFYLETEFSVENMSTFAIPLILTKILIQDYQLEFNHLDNQELANKTKIYARDYFYPISCNAKDDPDMFTKRTCMIHYYEGSWLPSKNEKRLKFQMIFGQKMGNRILDFLVYAKRCLKKILKILLFPIVTHKRKKTIEQGYIQQKNDFLSQMEKIGKKDYVVFYNKNWLGTGNATRELFQNVIGIDEIYDNRLKEDIANYIVDNHYKLVVFSAFSIGWKGVIQKIKELNPDIKIKVIWHGSHAMNVEAYDFDRFDEIFQLLHYHQIDSIGFVKKSMYDFYKNKGYPVEFLMNTVKIDAVKIKKGLKKPKDSKIRIGLYASGDRWVKNFYNQLGAASLFENCEIDCIPINIKTRKMARIFKTSLTGLTTPVSREELLKRMAKNDINFYVTFSECAPLIPLESLELGVPCITGNNHHYWEDTELQNYLIVNEADDCNKIYKKALYCLEHKEQIINLFTKWKEEYDKKAKESIKNFLRK